MPLANVVLLSIQAAEACGTLEIDSALDTVGSLGRDLEAYEKSAEDGKLLPLPGETVSSYRLPKCPICLPN